MRWVCSSYHVSSVLACSFSQCGKSKAARMLVRFWLQLGSLAVSSATVADIQPRSLADQIVESSY